MYTSLNKLSHNRTAYRLARAEKAIGRVFGTMTRAQIAERKRQGRLVRAEIRHVDNTHKACRTFIRQRLTKSYNVRASVQDDEASQKAHMQARASDGRHPIGQRRKRDLLDGAPAIARRKDTPEESRDINPKRCKGTSSSVPDEIHQVNDTVSHDLP